MPPTSSTCRWSTLGAAARPQFFPVILLPVAVAVALAHAHGAPVAGHVVALLVAGGVFAHAGANLLNDVYDHRYGVDDHHPNPLTPYAGGSRFIQDGRCSAATIAITGWLCAAAGVAVAGLLAGLAGRDVLPLLILGALGGVAYSAPPLVFDRRGLGLPLVVLDFGLLPVFLSDRILTGDWRPVVLLPGAAIGLAAATILMAAEFPDREADAQGGKRTLVVRLSAQAAGRVLIGLIILSHAAILGSIGLDLLHPLSAATLILVPWQLRAARHSVTTPHLSAPIRCQIIAHALLALLMIGGALLRP